MKKDEILKLAESVIDWCAKNVGYSKYYDDLPTIEVEYDSLSSVRAEYCPLNNVVTLYAKENRSVRQVVMSVMHEYRHYLQCPSWLERYSGLYRRKQHKNPYEVDAEKFANDNWVKFMLDTKR